MNRMNLLVAPLLLLAAAATALAQSDEDEIFPPDESIKAERCVTLARVLQTEALDNRNILFHMRGGEIYRNVLPRRCPGLERDRGFGYRTSIGRLCDDDTITLLSGFGPGDLAGPTCQLGKFYAVSKTEAEALRLEVERIKELGLEKQE